MHREDIVLAAMAAGGEGARFDPVRIQKLLFVIDREVSIEGAPHFEFQAYHYGPFDVAVYEVLDQLVEANKVEVHRSGQYREYSLSGTGRKPGQDVLAQLARRTSGAMTKVARWVLSLSFWDLIAAIYRKYPEMAANSRIPQAMLRTARGTVPRLSRPFLSGMTRGFGI